MGNPLYQRRKRGTTPRGGPPKRARYRSECYPAFRRRATTLNRIQQVDRMLEKMVHEIATMRLYLGHALEALREEEQEEEK